MSAPVAGKRVLSAKQLQAAFRTGQDVCVIAGPGSGKTSVLIERFYWLVEEQCIAPNRILTITFTERAATEIKTRMLARFEQNPEVRQQIERAYVSTVHAFCARLIRENSIAAQVDPQFEILDWAASNQMLRRATDDILEDTFIKSPDRMQLFLRSLAVATETEGYVPDLAQSLMDILSAMRVAGVDISRFEISTPRYESDLQKLRSLAGTILNDRTLPNTPLQREGHECLREWARSFLDLPERPGKKHFELLRFAFKKNLVRKSPSCEAIDSLKELTGRFRAQLLLEYYADQQQLVVESLQSIDALYRQRKRSASALDFDDLEEQAIRLLTSSESLRRRISAQFDHVLMDELQDTNPLQWQLLSLIRRDNNFFAVGDVNQSIFGFRHAKPELFLNYRRHLEGQGLEIDELRDNYRSRTPVLDVVNRLFHGAQGIEAHMLDGRSSFPDKQQSSVEAICVAAEKALEAERIEAQWVAKRIQELVGALVLQNGKAATFSDVAVLTRSNQATAALQEALDQYAVPSIVLGGFTLFETREIRDIILLLSVLVNTRNEIALAGLLRSPFFGLSDEDLLRLTLTSSLAEGVAKTPPPGWDLILCLRAKRNRIGPDRLVREALDRTGYEVGLSSRARANIEKVLASLRRRYAAQPAPLAQTLRDLESAAPEAEAAPSDFGDTVRLMTIHKSKGLEFPIVFLPFLHASRGTGFPIVSYSHENGLGVKWRDPFSRVGVPDTIHEANQKLSNGQQLKEDDRVLYVGTTRAKEHMVVSFSQTKYSRGEWAKLVGSRLGVDTAQATNEPIEQGGVRLLVTDRAPQQPEVNAVLAAHSNVLYLPRVAATGQQDATASVTDVSVFEQCPRRYYLSRYVRWKAPGGVSLPAEQNEEQTGRSTDDGRGELNASELGNQVHSLLSGQPVQDPAPEALSLASRFHASALGKQAKKSSNKRHEYGFVYDLQGLILRGQIDLVFESGKDLILVDYKTDGGSAPALMARVAPYELQIRLYARAIEKTWGRLPSRAYLYFLRPDLPVEVDLSPLALHMAQQSARQLSEAQDRLEFPIRPDDHCRRCEFRANLCPVG